MKNLAEKVAKSEKATNVVEKSNAKQTSNEKFENSAKMEGEEKAARVKSELAKAYDRAEVKANELFRERCLASVQNMVFDCIREALTEERDKLQAREIKEYKVITQILEKGASETANFTIKYSDTESGLTETPAEDLHTMFTAAKQSMLKVKIAEREEKAAAAAAEEERKLSVMAELGVTAEQIAALKAAGVIK